MYQCQAWLDTLFSQHELIHFIATYGYGVVALIIFLESLGLPLPGETMGSCGYPLTQSRLR